MTKKRFVKLAMASGYSRNAANRIAEGVPASGKSYADADILPAVSETVQRIIEVFGRMMNAFIEGAAAFSKAFSAAMAEE